MINPRTKSVAVKRAFTLIELLISAAIFATTVVVAAGIFGSGSKMQTATLSAIHNQQLANSISEKMFDDLKSANYWGQLEAKNNGRPRVIFNVKGFISLIYTPSLGSPLNVPTLIDDKINLVLAYKDNNDDSYTLTAYYREDSPLNKLHRASGSFKKADDKTITSTKIGSLKLTDSATLITSEGSKITDLTFTGQNYIGIVSPSKPDFSDQSGRYQPLLTMDLKLIDTNALGVEQNNKYQLKTSISGRNYREEP